MKDPRNQLRRAANEVRRFLTGKLPKTIGKLAEDHFKESFDKEGFTDTTLKKWPEVERRKHPVGVASTRRARRGTAVSNKRRTDKILHDSGDLHESIKWDQDYDNRIIIKSDLPYAQIHNQGGKAGRGHKATIPQRQFMGPSKALDKKLQKEVIRAVDMIFKFK